MGRECSACEVKERRVHGFGVETCGKETRRRREDNINMNLQEVGCGRMDWIMLD
jgi:hypothetical protein